MKMSYMVGFGANFPKRMHHRRSSLPSLASHPQAIGYNSFQPYYYTSDSNPNILVGAIVGGPNQNDHFADHRTDYSHFEPTTVVIVNLRGLLVSRLHSKVTCKTDPRLASG